MQRTEKIIVKATIVILLAALPSCGYRFSGTGDLVPQGATSIAIPVFINGTNEPYIDVDLTQTVVNEFLTDGRLSVRDLDEADLALHGRVTGYQVSALAYTSDTYVQRYQVLLTVDARLEDLRTKKIIWQENGIQTLFISDYPVAYDPVKVKASGGEEIIVGYTANIQDTKVSKDAAIKQASRDIASTLRSRVLEGF